MNNLKIPWDVVSRATPRERLDAIVAGHRRMAENPSAPERFRKTAQEYLLELVTVTSGGEQVISSEILDAMIRNHATIAGSQAPESVRQTSKNYVDALQELKDRRGNIE